ncbi:hypothetical protein LDC_2200 [sediment metagenome]|uniref:Uncharacterized protein n=1 Tax=sediment metagenome TaxID=749907 RepID=D9PKX9_9ZZZZ
MELDTRKLDELLELTRENNKILTGMRSAQRWGSFFKLVYWMVILGSILGVYYYFQPTIQKYANTLQTAAGVLQGYEQQVGNISTQLQSVGNLLKTPTK